MNGAERIAAERKRQVEAEGWTPEHDDDHDKGELLAAAGAYAFAATCQLRHEVWGHSVGERVPNDWPWDDESWHPSTSPVRNLEKAGALIAAEIDRLVREKNGRRHLVDEVRRSGSSPEAIAAAERALEK